MLSNKPLRAVFTVMFFTYILWSYLFFFMVGKYLHGKGKRRKALDRLHERHSRKVYWFFTTLKGVYLKIGQFLSTQIALLPPVYLLELSKMQDRVPKVGIEVIRKRIREEYGKEWNEVFERLEEEPLASASIGQVHRVTMKDGREAVIKVKYPHVEKFFISDIKILEFFSPYFVAILHFAYYKERTGFDIKPTIKEFGKYISLELDYRNEVRNHKIMYDMLKDHPNAVVPRLYLDYCTDAIICMEYIDGARITDWYGDMTPAEKMDVFYKRLVDSFLHTLTKYGTFQADTHPGNFLVVDDGQGPKPVFLDFGCVKQFPDDFRQGTIDIMQGYINRDSASTAQVLDRLGYRTKKGTVESLEVWVKYGFEITDLVVDHFKDGENLIDYLKANMIKMTEDFQEVDFENRIQEVPEEYFMLGRVLATPPIPIDRYQPRVDLMSILMPHMLELTRKGPFERERVAGAKV